MRLLPMVAGLLCTLCGMAAAQDDPGRVGPPRSAHPYILSGVLLALVVGGALPGCASRGARPSHDVGGSPAPPEEGRDGLLVRGGAVVRRAAPAERLDLLLERHDGFLVLAAAAGPGQLHARDTLDIEGLYVHSANHFEATVDTTPSLRPGALSIAKYVVREGAGPGSRATWLIGPYSVERLAPADNRPSGPEDERVGCYSMERGRWSDPDFELDPDRAPLWFPDSLRLHWQLHWPNGPDPYLVATDIDGRIGGERISYYGWAPVGADSLRVQFGVWYMGTTFEGAATTDGYEGAMTVWSDGGTFVQAPARLRRVQCPEAE